MVDRNRILAKFALFAGDTGGIDSWLGVNTSDEVIARLGAVAEKPLSKVQLNQLLILSHEAGISDGFFRYYWLTAPEHAYDVRKIEGFDATYLNANSIISLEHLRWGIYRIYVDALLFFGSIRNGYRHLRGMSHDELARFFGAKRFDTAAIRARGPALPLEKLSKDNRYLISEMACKSYDVPAGGTSELKSALLEAWMEHQQRDGGRVRIRDLLDGSYVSTKYADRRQQMLFSADDMLDYEVTSREELEVRYEAVATAFAAARRSALKNTRYYLSMVNDLDVYVATSMRTRQDFRSMADACEDIFADPRLQDLHLRYFDPTLSAAEGHEDKGLIECLMVKSAKVLIYSAGQKESYGKDAEAAMALSLGKPVVFLCDEAQRQRFYRDVHPLSRLIDFSTGVAVGAMVTAFRRDVAELLNRLFRNDMEYALEHPKPGYFRLREGLTESVVRLQTNDVLLRETFWNYYHGSQAQRADAEAARIDDTVRSNGT